MDTYDHILTTNIDIDNVGTSSINLCHQTESHICCSDQGSI